MNLANLAFIVKGLATESNKSAPMDEQRLAKQ